MSTRPTDPRGASRRGPTAFGEETGYDIANDAQPKPRTFHPPSGIRQINAAIRTAQASGKCAVCGQPVSGGGATCKQPACISKWVLGR